MVYTGLGQRGSHTSLAGSLETLLAQSICQAMLVVVAKVLACHRSFRFLTCHHGWHLAFIEGLIGECLMPPEFCWLTTLQGVEGRYPTEPSCSLCILPSLTGGAWLAPIEKLPIEKMRNNSKDSWDNEKSCPGELPTPLKRNIA